MHDRALVDALALGIMPRELLPLADWMDRNIVLERGGVTFNWETAKTPYWRAVMDDLGVDSPVEEIVIQKPSQVGASELAIGFCCYIEDVAPCSILYIMPDLEAAARHKQLRIDPVIKNSPRVRSLFRAQKSRDSGNTMHQLLCDGGSWTLVGSNSPAGLASLPAPIVIFDERDRASASAGVGVRAEGDQYLLAKARTTTFRDTFPRRKLVQISSPGEASTSKIEPAWRDSDRRRLWVPCSECNTRIVYSMRRLWWPRGGDPRAARYRCQVCDRLLDERTKLEMLTAGEWIPESPKHDVRGYKLIGLDSPFLRWGEMAAERERVKGNPNEFRVYVNTIEGETYDMHAEAAVDVESLKLLATPIRFEDGRPVIPAGVGLLTAGSDTQPNRLEFTLRGWGRGEEQWHVDHVILPGDASARAVWDDLDILTQTLWLTERGMSIGLGAMCTDTAGRNTIPAYNFVRGKASRRIWGTVGRSGQGRKLWPRRPSRSNIGKVDLYTIGIDGAKHQLYARLKASIEQVQRGEPRGGPGFVHIAAHLCEDVIKPDGSREPSEYLQQLVAEYPKTRMTRTGPVIEWTLKREHAPNEVLDCDVLAQAALAGWRALRKSLEGAVERMNPPTATPAPVAPAPRIDIPSHKTTSPNRERIEPSPNPTAPPKPPRLTKAARKRAPDYM